MMDDSVLNDDHNKGREQTFAEPELEDVGHEDCPTCNGTRLNPTARAVRFNGISITDIARMSVGDVRLWVQGLKLVGRESEIARDLVAEIGSAFVCAQTGIALEGLQHDRYVASWLKVLKGDKRAIFTASSQAKKAAEFLMASAEEEEALAA